jgi:hypothetical protein
MANESDHKPFPKIAVTALRERMARHDQELRTILEEVAEMVGVDANSGEWRVNLHKMRFERVEQPPAEPQPQYQQPA